MPAGKKKKTLFHSGTTLCPNDDNLMAGFGKKTIVIDLFSKAKCCNYPNVFSEIKSVNRYLRAWRVLMYRLQKRNTIQRIIPTHANNLMREKKTSE